MEGLKQRNSDTESDQDTKGVLPVEGLMDHILTTTADGYLQEFQVKSSLVSVISRLNLIL